LRDTCALLGPSRDTMLEKGLNLQDGLIMRALANFPGGLELHIGVRAYE
jgi:hypothetical protein